MKWAIRRREEKGIGKIRVKKEFYDKLEEEIDEKGIGGDEIRKYLEGKLEEYFDKNADKKEGSKKWHKIVKTVTKYSNGKTMIDLERGPSLKEEDEILIDNIEKNIGKIRLLRDKEEI